MDIKELFEKALLAQAAYVDRLTPGLTGEKLVDELITVKGITQAQAEYFSSKYVVVQQINNSETGFSATLFQDIETGEYHLAIRGSASFSFIEPDWIDANVNNLFNGIAFNQVADLLNFYLRLTHSEEVAQFEFEEVILPEDSTAPEASIIIEYVYEDLDNDGDVENSIKYLVFSDKDDPVPGLAAITDNQKINVTGHSLGGHLASVF